MRQRNIAFNTQLAAVCSQFDSCLFDNNAVFNTPFTTGDVSGDYFHPSIAGQAKLASVTWSAGFTWTTSPPPPVNDPPVAGFSATCAELTCSFVNASSADATSFSWTFGDGGTAATPNASHTYASGDTYTVTLTVSDPEGLSDATSQSVVVAQTPPPVTFMSIQSFTATGQSTGKNTWAATATAVITDSNGRPVDGASVSVTWSSGSGGCTTNASGSCSLTTGDFNLRKVASVVLTVTGVSRAGVEWDGAGVQATASRP